MKSKKQNSLENLKKQRSLKCIHCNDALHLENNSLTCNSGHVFDVAKKGNVHLAKNSIENIYHLSLFENRRKVLSSYIFKDFIDGVLNSLSEYLQLNSVVIDCGTGEGTFLSKIANQYEEVSYFGLDLDKSGIEHATDYVQQDVSWLVANLAELPFIDNSVDVILNILSPASYNEFRRVLVDDGYIVKVIPGSGYLRELRELAASNGMLAKAEYDNFETVSLLKKNAEIIDMKKMTYTIGVDELDLKRSLSKMTPLMENVEMKDESLVKLEEITIDLEIYIGLLNK